MDHTFYVINVSGITRDFGKSTNNVRIWFSLESE